MVSMHKSLDRNEFVVKNPDWWTRDLRQILLLSLISKSAETKMQMDAILIGE